MDKRVEFVAAHVRIGGVMAAVLSWDANHSIIWMWVHLVFGWGYVIYRALGYGA